jgi:hypothetical protein
VLNYLVFKSILNLNKFSEVLSMNDTRKESAKLTERLIGTLQELQVVPGYHERDYSLDTFKDILKALDAAMTDIIAVLAQRSVFLIRVYDKKIFKVLPRVIKGSSEQDTDITNSLLISVRALKPDYDSTELEKSSVKLKDLIAPNPGRFGFVIFERVGDSNTLNRSSTILEQVNSIIGRYNVVYSAVEADFARAAAARREADRLAQQARDDRRAQRLADEERRAERRAQRQAIEDEEAALTAALEAGDQETIDRIAAARADRYAAEMNAVANEAAQAAERVQNRVNAVEAAELPDGVDNMSFIYGWLAGHVDYLYAKLPGWDRHAESSFTNRYPEAPKTEIPGEPGYSVTDKDKKTSGGYHWQLANEYHVHFKRETVQRAPDIVRVYLGAIRSSKTGEASQIKGDISSNALAQHLIINLGFGFDKTENTNAYNTCRNMATNKADFDLGYNWTAPRRRAIQAAPAPVPAFNPEVEAEENPLAQDFPEVV